MSEYVKLRPGVTAETVMTQKSWREYAELSRADQSPGEGWYEVVKGEKPPPEEGKVLAWTYARDGDVMRKTYSWIDPPQPPRVFSKLYLYVALARIGKYDALVDWLKGQTMPDGVNAYVAYDAANELSDAHPLFAQWYAAAKQALGIDDATAEQILAAAMTGGDR